MIQLQCIFASSYIRMYTKIVFYILIIYLNVALSCNQHETCQQCILDAKNCVWCAANSNDVGPRCRPENSYDPEWCTDFLEKPENVSITVSPKFDRNFSSDQGDVVQIKPQQMHVKLRPGQPINFDFSFQAAENYPVDLYILLDASDTMKKIKSELSYRSSEIYNTIYAMTKNVQIGFGTYIDKNIQPFTKNVSANTAYSFKNHLNLTSNYTELESIINKTTFGKNYDPAEGGFDALAQVLACSDAIGWRKQSTSRRIIVFITDTSHHVVGDGRAAGIFKPYDEKCYTNTEGDYTNELTMDYPSVATISKLAAAKDTIIIFTLNPSTGSSKIIAWYEYLLQAIHSSKKVILYKNDIVPQLKKIYTEVSQQIVLNAVAKSGHTNKFKISFRPNCVEGNKDNKCKVEIGARRDFTGTITLENYYGLDSETIEITIIEGVKEKLTLNVQIIKCACEKVEDNNSTQCFGQKFQCGICICDASTYGNRCMCSKDKKTNKADETQCLSLSGKICSGNGKCNCGHCVCNDKFLFGKFCECNRKNCPGFLADSEGKETEVCSGHGDCKCSSEPEGNKEICLCDDDWTHQPDGLVSDCSCHETGQDKCKVDGMELCNNRGKCSCNSCKCDNIKPWDQRINQNDLCVVQPCPDCHNLQCNSIQSCVRCHLDSDNCAKECDGIELEKKYDVLPEEYFNNTKWHVCSKQKIDMGCYNSFVYRYDDKQYRILLNMQNDKNCAENYYVFGGILLLTILVIGILTLLGWKCLIHHRDLMEFKKFEAQHKKELGTASENPIYHEPTTTIRNPAFQRSFSNK